MLKKIITIYFLLLCFYSKSQNSSLSVGTNCNQTVSDSNQKLMDNDHQKNYCLISNKKFNKIETKLLEAGLTSVIFPLAISESDKYKGSYGFEAIKVCFVFGGILLSLISTLYFISAKPNKKKAIELKLLPNYANAHSGLCVNLK